VFPATRASGARPGLCALFAAAALLLGSSQLGAQHLVDDGPDPSRVRFRIGPLRVDPTFALTNFGVDTNVFNEPDEAGPKRDETMTLEPGADLWLPLGRTWLTGGFKENVVWYRRFTSQRSANSSYSAGWVAPLARIALSVDGKWMHTRERPGFEIDARAPRRESSYSGSVEVSALPRTFVGARASTTTVDFDDDAEFSGTSLRAELNRTTTAAGVTLRRELTPLTSVVLEVSQLRDRFEFASQRDSDSMAVGLSVKFSRDALLNGSAQVGMRRFSPAAVDLPEFSGATVAVDLGYVAAESTKLVLQATRNVEYSFEIERPYYILTGISGSIAQQIFGPIEAIGRLGGQQLAYRERAGAAVDFSGRIDHVRTVGGGVGYRLAPGLRVGVDVDRAKRTSGVARRQYHGLRYGVSINYRQ
jgi:hypothetical protein